MSTALGREEERPVVSRDPGGPPDGNPGDSRFDDSPNDESGARRSSALPERGHLDQVDLFRITTFAAVVGVHTIGSGSSALSEAGNALLMLGHYTREAFFFLTGLVLSHSLRDRPLVLRRFWPRRVPLVALPYLCWSVVYVWYGRWRGSLFGVTPGPLWHQLWYETLLGQASYHLYFLLVTVQIYLLFPLVHRFRRTLNAHPARVLLSTAAVDAAVMYLSHGSHPAGPVGGFLHRWTYLTIVPYLFWVLAGAWVAARLPAVQSWLWRHRVVVVIAALATFAAALAVYVDGVRDGVLPPNAADAVQPVIVASATGAILLQAVLALGWVRRRRPGSVATRLVMWGSTVAFGVYLIHPIVLDRLLAHGFNGDRQSYLFAPWSSGLPKVRLGQPAAGLLVWILTLAVSGLIISALRWTPLSLALTGRARRRPGWPNIARRARP